MNRFLFPFAAVLLLSGCASIDPRIERALQGEVIQLDLMWMEFDPADLTSHPTFQAEARVTDAAVRQAFDTGKGSLIWVQKLHTVADGSDCHVHVGQELTYPTEFDVSENDIQVNSGGNDNAAASATTPTVIPGGFETRNLGFSMNVRTVRLPDGLVGVILSPEFAELVEWSDFGSSFALADSKVQKVEMRVPVIHSSQVDLDLRLRPGEPTIAHLTTNSQTGKISVLVISARP